jgi:hypothetical protein
VLIRVKLLISGLIQLLRVKELSATVYYIQILCEEGYNMVFRVIEGGDSVAKSREWRLSREPTTDDELVRLLRVKHIFSGRFGWYFLVSLSILRQL